MAKDTAIDAANNKPTDLAGGRAGAATASAAALGSDSMTDAARNTAMEKAKEIVDDNPAADETNQATELASG